MSNTILHELALRVLKAQSMNEINRSRETSDATKEGKLHGISPNEILSHIQLHYDEFNKEINSGVGTLSSFTESWKAQNPDKPINEPEFLQALTAEAKKYTHFDFTK